MSDLKKIAAEIRKWNELRDYMAPDKWADALDALAAQEPVAWQDKGETDYILSDSQFDRRCRDANDYRPLYAAPQPAQSQEPVAWRYKTKGIGDWWHPISTKHGWLNDTRHEIEPLYAAPQRMTVSREALVAAYAELFNNDDPSALRALGIEVK